jgi:hypothetical protein
MQALIARAAKDSSSEPDLSSQPLPVSSWTNKPIFHMSGQIFHRGHKQSSSPRLIERRDIDH